MSENRSWWSPLGGESSLAIPNGVWSFLDGPASYLSAAVALYLVFYLFPRGQFSPRWLGWATLMVIGVDAGNSLFPGSALDVDRWVPNLENLFFFGLLAALAGAQVYRYIRVYNPIEQQQSKWVIFSVAIFAAFGLAVFVLAPLLVGTMFLSTSLLGVIGPFAFVDIFALLFPISFAIAIFRYRLWDIDLIINRALVYGSLSLLLAGVYVGAVIGLQVLAEAVTGQHSTQPVAIVASTLLIAALFEPLRRRLQTAIDRRFYRSKYDAARTLATFSATLRGELDLHELTERLQVVVSETMQPAHVSLWLMPSRRSAVEEGQEA